MRSVRHVGVFWSVGGKGLCVGHQSVYCVAPACTHTHTHTCTWYVLLNVETKKLLLPGLCALLLAQCPHTVTMP